MARILGWAWWIVVFGRRQAWNARRDHRNAAFLFYTAVAAVGDVIALLWSLSIVLFMLGLGEWLMASVFSVLLSTLMMRRVVIEHVTVPLGLFRTTHTLAELDRWLGSEPLGVARLTAARALARAGVPDDAAAWWQSISHARLGAHDIAAQAVLAGARGDRADARALFESLLLLSEPAPRARELAAEWLALDDAGAGRWQAILDRATARARPRRGWHRRPDAIAAAHEETATPAPGGEMLWPATGITFFLEGVAGRMLGRADAPSQLGLWLRWIESSSRRAMWPLLQRALAAAASQPARGSHAHTTPCVGADPLPRAISLHTAALVRPTEASLVAATAAWDAALADPSWRTAIAERAITLGAPPDAASRAVDELRAQVIVDVAHAILGAGVPLTSLLARAGDDSGILGAAAARARAELLGRLELAFERVGGRVQDRTSLASIDEWRSFLALRSAYTEAARQGGVELERLAYPHAHSELTSWTVWMWNDRKEHVISHGMTTWLYERALAVGDAQAIELHGKNAALEPTTE